MNLKFTLILVAVFSVQAIDYAAESQKRCSASILLQLQSEGAERKALRQKYNVTVGMNINDFEKVLKGDSSGILKGEPITFLIFGFILFLFALVLFIIFLANLCCCKKAETSASKVNCYLITNGVFFIIFLVFLILTLAYSIKVMKSQEPMKCQIVKMPNNLLNGVNTATVYFIGINPLIDLLTNLSTEVSNISSVEQNFQNIVNLNLPQSTQDGITRADDYENAFKALQIASG